MMTLRLIIKEINMNKEIKTISKTVIVACLCILSYKMGKGDPIIEEKIVEVQVIDKGFCMSCYKKHKWDEMYVIASEFEGFIYN